MVKPADISDRKDIMSTGMCKVLPQCTRHLSTLTITQYKDLTIWESMETNYKQYIPDHYLR